MGRIEKIREAMHTLPERLSSRPLAVSEVPMILGAIHE